MSVDVLYQTAARATGGRDGRSATLDGTFDVSLTKPKELGGPGGNGANPEKLFAAGYAACFLGAMKVVASQGGPKVPSDGDRYGRHRAAAGRGLRPDHRAVDRRAGRFT